MKRSNFTHYVAEDTLIYEYKEAFFVMERCQQGKELNPAHGSRQFPSDVSTLTARLDIPCTALALGQAVLKSLDDFDTRGHPYDEFDLPARNKYIAGLIGARGMPSLERDSRTVVVVRSLDDMGYTIQPTDNNVLNPWLGVLTGEFEIKLPSEVSAEDVGAAVLKAFSLSTYHPKRKTPPTRGACRLR